MEKTKHEKAKMQYVAKYRGTYNLSNTTRQRSYWINKYVCPICNAATTRLTNTMRHRDVYCDGLKQKNEDAS